MKIVFVGLHNKEGKQALDSSTFTGKIVDEIIEQLKAPCVKMNLFDAPALPKGEEASFMKRQFVINANFQPEDIGVFLGAVVHEAVMELQNGGNSPWKIDLAHPGSLRYSGMKRQEYIQSAVERIKAVENYKRLSETPVTA